MDGLVGFGLPFLINSTKSRDEKIEEARKSGLIKNEYDLRGPNAQVFCCRFCGSKNLAVGMPDASDFDKGMQVPYICKDCGYEGLIPVKVRKVENGTLEVDVIPDGLIGVVSHLNDDKPGRAGTFSRRD